MKCKNNPGAEKKSSGKGASSKPPKSATVLDKVVFSIRFLKGGPRGSSRPAIAKYLQSELDCNNPTALKAALKKGVTKGVLIQNSQSFRVASDPVEAAEKEQLVQTEDVVIGSSDREAQHGDNVVVAYEGTLENGHQFDKAAKFAFLLGAGDVIKGWDTGLVGMRKGGKRKLIVPSGMGYGKRGCKPDIPPNATLHFVVKMKSINSQDS